MAQWWVSVSLDLRGRLPEQRLRRVSETQRTPMNTAQKPLPSGISIVSTEPGHAVSLCEAVGEVARERRWLAAVEAFQESETQLFVQLNQTAGVPQFVALYGPKVVGWCDKVRLYPYPGYEHNARLGMGVLAPWMGARGGAAVAGPGFECGFGSWIPARGTGGLCFKHGRGESLPEPRLRSGRRQAGHARSGWPCR